MVLTQVGGIHDGFTTKISGTIENRGTHHFTHVSVRYGVYGQNGYRAGTAKAITYDIPPGGKWDFTTNSVFCEDPGTYDSKPDIWAR